MPERHIRQKGHYRFRIESAGVAFLDEHITDTYQPQHQNIFLSQCYIFCRGQKRNGSYVHNAVFFLRQKSCKALRDKHYVLLDFRA